MIYNIASNDSNDILQIHLMISFYINTFFSIDWSFDTHVWSVYIHTIYSRRSIVSFLFRTRLSLSGLNKDKAFVLSFANNIHTYNTPIFWMISDFYRFAVSLNENFWCIDAQLIETLNYQLIFNNLYMICRIKNYCHCWIFKLLCRKERISMILMILSINLLEIIMKYGFIWNLILCINYFLLKRTNFFFMKRNFTNNKQWKYIPLEYQFVGEIHYYGRKKIIYLWKYLLIRMPHCEQILSMSTRMPF